MPVVVASFTRLLTLSPGALMLMLLLLLMLWLIELPWWRLIVRLHSLSFYGYTDLHAPRFALSWLICLKPAARTCPSRRACLGSAKKKIIFGGKAVQDLGTNIYCNFYTVIYHGTSQALIGSSYVYLILFGLSLA